MGQVNQDYELVTAMPITFKIDGNLNVKDPKGRFITLFLIIIPLLYTETFVVSSPIFMIAPT